MSDIVSIRLMGGLGNQLFQIFTTIVYGIKSNRKTVLPYTETLRTGIERPTYWENFLSTLKMITTFNPGYGITNGTFVRFSNVFEREFHYQEIPKVQYREVLLNGYYQSYKYFDDYKTTIFSMIHLQEQKNKVKQEFSYLFLEDIHYVSMHFRLGDYVKIQDCHPLLTYEYYEKAVTNIVENRNRKIQIIYFCQKEDNNTVSTMIDKLNEKFPEVLFIKANDDIPDWKQMIIMSCCHDNIIANSTFSWWGAYFNTYKDKKVCYPSTWFGPKLKHDTSDLFPEEWIKIL